MSKKATKAEISLIILVVIVGTPVFLISKLFEKVSIDNVIIFVILGFILLGVLVATLSAYRKKIEIKEREERHEMLMRKYSDTIIVDAIIACKIWLGQTSEQLVESVGRPVDIDEKRLKTKKKEVWKYMHQGANRFGLRVTLDNDIVVGWEKK